MGFISSALFRDLSLAGNYALIESKVEDEYVVSGSNGQNIIPISRQLQGQSPYILNVGLYYDNAGIGTKASLTYNQTGPQIAAVSMGNLASGGGGGGYAQSGEMGSLIALTRRQLDFSITQRIGKGLQLKFSVQNILNNPIEVAGDENFTYKYEKVTYNPDGSKAAGDWIFESYKTEPFYNLNLSYSF